MTGRVICGRSPLSAGIIQPQQKATRQSLRFRCVLLTACDVLDDKVYDGHGHHHVDDFKVHPTDSEVVFVIPEDSSLEILSPDAAKRTVYGDSERVSSKM